MRAVGVFGQHHVAAGRLEPLDESLAALDGIVVVGRAVEDADWARGDVRVVLIGRRTIGVEGNVGGELDTGLVPELVETVEARLERRLSTA